MSNYRKLKKKKSITIVYLQFYVTPVWNINCLSPPKLYNRIDGYSHRDIIPLHQ